MNSLVLENRLNNFKKELQKNKIDAALVASEVGRFYFSRFTCSKAFFLITPKKSFCLMDGRYYHRALKEIGSVFTVIETKKDFKDEFLLMLKKQKIKVLGIEHKYYTLSKFKNLKKILKGMGIKFVDVSKIISDLRAVKDASELNAIKKSAQVTDKAFDYIFNFIKDNYKIGLKEKDIAWNIEKFIRENGGDGISFDPIVASGSNSAFPHHCGGEKKIKYGDVILLDFGSVVDGYSSDMTRTIFIGKPSEKQTEVYKLVLQAQTSALQKIKHGANVCEIDGAAREVVDNSKYKDKFLHACGHGVGLEIHELPNLRKENKTEILKEGMVVAVEPGVYLNKQFGVRIEDLVLVTKNGCKYLSKSVKDFDSMVIKY
ncbi:MAG: Xaa-Pro peptidase family protein [bacterium]